MFEILLPWLHYFSHNACPRYLKSRRDLLYVLILYCPFLPLSLWLFVCLSVSTSVSISFSQPALLSLFSSVTLVFLALFRSLFLPFSQQVEAPSSFSHCGFNSHMRNKYQMGGWMDGWMNEWMVRWMNGGPTNKQKFMTSFLPRRLNY